MTTRSKTLRALALALIALGVAIALALSVGGIWADLEASMFDRALDADARFGALRCPTIMTVDKPGSIRATLSNTTDNSYSPRIRVHISDGFLTLMREETATVALAPGERQRFEWPITAEDAAYGRVVLVRAWQSPWGLQPDRAASCGVLVLDVPFLGGGQLVGLAIALSVLTMGGGLALWHLADRPMRKRDQRIGASLITLAIVILLTVILTLIEFWLFALGALIIATLTIGGIIAHFWFVD